MKNKSLSIIKINNLKRLLKENGLLHIEKTAIISIEDKINDFTYSLIKIAKQNMLINGRRTLRTEDV